MTEKKPNRKTDQQKTNKTQRQKHVIKPKSPAQYYNIKDHPEFRKTVDQNLVKKDIKIIRNKFYTIFQKVVIQKTVDAEKYGSNNSLEDLVYIAATRLDKYLLRNYPECLVSSYKLVETGSDELSKNYTINVVIEFFEKREDRISLYDKLTIR